MLYRRRVGAREQEAIVGVMATGCPHLLSVDDPLVTVEHCCCLEACQVATAVWFAKALAPAHLAIQNLWQKFLLLFFSTPLQQCWANKCVAKKIGAHWCLCICKLFCQHHTLQSRQTFAAVFDWPRRTNPATFKQLCWPRFVKRFARGRRHLETCIEPSLRKVGLEPGLYFSSKGLCLGGVFDHASILPAHKPGSPSARHEDASRS